MINLPILYRVLCICKKLSFTIVPELPTFLLPYSIVTISLIAVPFVATTGSYSVYGQSSPASSNLDSAMETNNNTGTIGSVPLANASTVVDASNQFALDFYSRLTNNSEDTNNIFFSPWSISNAFVVAYEGARGETAKEMESVFHFPNDTDQRRSDFLKVNDALVGSSNKTNANYTLDVANGLWVHEGYKISDEYVNLAKQYYKSEVANTDLTSIEGVNTINQWVESKTHDKIKNLLSPDAVDQLTRLAITNAVYFNGTWAEPFDETKTKQEDFHVNDTNETVKVPMMKLDQTEFNYTETEEGLQVLQMPYQGGNLSMLILLPKDSSDIQTLERSLTVEDLAQWRSKLAEEQVIVEMPKFKLDTSYDLVGMLADMGMPTAFTPKVADFTGITEQDSDMMYLKAAIHKAFVDVNEKGTEAAGATGITASITSMPATPPPVYHFRADHPFVFMIQENDTGNILFMGKIVKPQAE